MKSIKPLIPFNNDPMKFNFFGRRPKCAKCGKKFKTRLS